MSRILKRPMFRKGGPTNGMTGIMSGIQDRQNYAVGTQDVYPTDIGFNNFGQGTRSAKELGYDFDFAVPTFRKGDTRSLSDIRSGYEKELLAAAGERGGYDPLTTFLLQYGPAVASATPRGGFLSTALGAAKEPLSTMLKEKAEEDRFKRGVRLQATGRAIETKEAEDKAAMEIENKLEIAKADVINKGKELQNKIYANKELTDAERDNLLTQLASNRKLALEKLDKQYEGQLKLEKFKLENKEQEPDQEKLAVRAEILKEDLNTYPGQPTVATRSTDFKTNLSGDLYKKVGSRAGGVLTFDINDVEQRKQNQSTLDKLIGKFVYDPFADKIHKITKDGFESFSSIEEIKLKKEDPDLETKKTSGLTEEEIKGIKERYGFYLPEEIKKIQEQNEGKGFGYGLE